jgi:hypothetical protein
MATAKPTEAIGRLSGQVRAHGRDRAQNAKVQEGSLSVFSRLIATQAITLTVARQSSSGLVVRCPCGMKKTKEILKHGNENIYREG